MSNLNVKKVLVEAPTESFTAGKEYEVFMDRGYTYILDEVNDRLYFDLENKTFGYFRKEKVGLFSFGRGDLTIVPVIEKVKQVRVVKTNGGSLIEGDVYEVLGGRVPYIIDEVGDKLYFDLGAQTYGYFREENVDSWSFCEYGGVFLEEVKEDEQTEVDEVVMTGANEVKIEVGLKFEVVEQVELEWADYSAGEVYEVLRFQEMSDGLNAVVEKEGWGIYVNLPEVLEYAFKEGKFKVIEEVAEVKTDKVPRCITLQDIKEGKIKVGDRVACEEGTTYEVLEVDVRDTSLPLRLTEYGWWGLDYGDVFRVEVEVTYLDFQEDREPLATYDSEEVEIVEEGGKLVVYSKENK